MEPTSKDAIIPLMSKTQQNLRYLIYGLMSFDEVKVNRSTVNLASISQHTCNLTNYQHRGSVEEWEALCKDLQDQVNALKEHSEREELPQAAASFGKMLAVCIDCHEKYQPKKG